MKKYVVYNMLDTVSITLIVTSIANIIINLYGHIKKSSCCGMSIETEPLNN